MYSVSKLPAQPGAVELASSVGSQVAFLPPADALADHVHAIVLRRPSRFAAPLPAEQGFAANPFGALSIVHAGSLIDPDAHSPLAPLEFAGPRLHAARRHYQGVPVVTTVLFKPGVLHTWLDRPAQTLLNARWDARPWLSSTDQQVLLDLHLLSTTAQQVFALETLLLRWLRPLKSRWVAMTQPAGMSTSVSHWAQDQRCSPRQLHRRSLNHLGLAPKDLLRLHRLRHGMQMLTPDAQQPPMTTLARSVGYADAAHMAREMRALTGLSPTQLRLALRHGPAEAWTYNADHLSP